MMDIDKSVIEHQEVSVVLGHWNPNQSRWIEIVSASLIAVEFEWEEGAMVMYPWVAVFVCSAAFLVLGS